MVPTYVTGYTLDLVFTSGQNEDNLKMVNLESSALSSSDHHLLIFGLCTAVFLFRVDWTYYKGLSLKTDRSNWFSECPWVFFQLIWLVLLLKPKLPSDNQK